MPTDREKRGLVLIAGVGPGLGLSLMKRFQLGNYQAVGLSRTLPAAAPAGLELIQSDLTCYQQVLDSVHASIEKHGPPRVVIHNTAELVIGPFAELDIADFEQVWRSTVLSAANLAKVTFGPMAKQLSGVFIASGATASIRGGAKFAAFASAKFGLRGLVQSLAREYQPMGIHVAHVILDGIIDTPRSRSLHMLEPLQMLNPDDIADAYWTLAHQPSSAWSHEIDLRPMTEKF